MTCSYTDPTGLTHRDPGTWVAALVLAAGGLLLLGIIGWPIAAAAVSFSAYIIAILSNPATLAAVITVIAGGAQLLGCLFY